MAQDALDAFLQLQPGGVEIVTQLGLAGDRAVHARRLAEQDFQRHVHRLVVEMAVGDGQLALLDGLADHRERQRSRSQMALKVSKSAASTDST